MWMFEEFSWEFGLYMCALVWFGKTLFFSLLLCCVHVCMELCPIRCHCSRFRMPVTCWIMPTHYIIVLPGYGFDAVVGITRSKVIWDCLPSIPTLDCQFFGATPRCVLIILVILAQNGIFGLEQPLLSLAPRHKRLEWLTNRVAFAP